MSERKGYRKRQPGTHPPYDYAPYGSTHLRAPRAPQTPLRQTLSEITGPGPALSERLADDADLTTNAGTGGCALGERIIVTGRVLDEDGSPVPSTLVEVWQANAAGRYTHAKDDHDAPLDPNFTGVGRCHTDEEGWYRFVTVRPAAYPWQNHPNAWRPAHIHFSVFGPAFVTRLITQMYFQGDPLLELDPIVSGVPSGARDRIVARYDHSVTEAGSALGYRFNIVLRGPAATPFEVAGVAVAE